MRSASLPAKPRGEAAESPWSPSRLVRAATALHVLAAAALIVRPDLWAWVLGAIAATHGAMAALGMLPRNRLLGPHSFARLFPGDVRIVNLGLTLVAIVD